MVLLFFTITILRSDLFLVKLKTNSLFIFNSTNRLKEKNDTGVTAVIGVLLSNETDEDLISDDLLFSTEIDDERMKVLILLIKEGIYHNIGNE